MKKLYEFKFMHGDGDVYTTKSYLSKNETESNLIDFLTSLEFVSYNRKGIIYTEDSLKKAEQLYKLYYEEIIDEDWMDWNELKGKNLVKQSIEDFLCDDVGYIQMDRTCDGFHYATIKSVKRKPYVDKVIFTKQEIAKKLNLDINDFEIL